MSKQKTTKKRHPRLGTVPPAREQRPSIAPPSRKPTPPKLHHGGLHIGPMPHWRRLIGRRGGRR